MLCEDFYIDASVIAIGLGLASWGALTLDMTLFAIACLIAGGGAHEMHQRFNSDFPHRP